MLVPTLNRALMLHYRSLAMRRMTGVALAIRLYQLDAGGRRPETLDELVPKYLLAVPADPFADDGRGLGYLPHASPALLYSVNTDGDDDQGAFETNVQGVNADESADLVFFLDGDRPCRAPTTQPAADASSQPASVSSK